MSEASSATYRSCSYTQKQAHSVQYVPLDWSAHTCIQISIQYWHMRSDNMSSHFSDKCRHLSESFRSRAPTVSPAPASCCAAAWARRRSQSGDRQGAGRNPARWLGLAPDTVMSGDWCTTSVCSNSDWDPGEERGSDGRQENTEGLLGDTSVRHVSCMSVCTETKLKCNRNKKWISMCPSQPLRPWTMTFGTLIAWDTGSRMGKWWLKEKYSMIRVWC